MDNNRPASDDRGPRPAVPDLPLSTAQNSVLLGLHDQNEPTPLATLIAVTGLHENTLRGHLAALVRRGLVRRQQAPVQGRGRPAWLYESTGAEPIGSDYVGLAAALAAAIARTVDAPGRAATTAGEEWGRQLARDRGATRLPSAAAREQVIALLDDMGFEPDATRSRRMNDVRLTACPLLETARQYPEVVCAVHLGIVRGALTENGADPSSASLTPFAEPGSCRLSLAQETN